MLITHGTVCTLGPKPQVIDDGAVYIEGDHIAAVGPAAELGARYRDAERLDAAGQLVMPGAICAHTHFYGAFARGMSLPGEPPCNFPEILKKLWWRLDRALDEEAIRYSALVSLVDAIRNGTTTLIDHHASPNQVDGSLDIIAEAVEQSGLRACLCYEVTDRNGDEGAKAGIAENVRFIRRIRTANSRQVPSPAALLPTLGEGREERSPLLSAAFGLHASFTLSDRTLEHAAGEARALGSGFHIHVAEDQADQDDCLRQHGLRVAQRLERQGVLGQATLAAHCVHVDPREIAAIARTGTKVSHQPRSNMNNAVGTAPVQALLDAGVTVGLGNDGFSNNMFSEMKAAYLVHKLAAQDPRAIGGETVMRLAYTNNARIASLFWPRPVGSLEPGAYADVVLLDYWPYTPLTAGNLPWHVIFGLDGSHVTTTICAGRVLMKDRQLLTVDEEAIAANAREVAVKVWRRFAEMEE